MGADIECDTDTSCNTDMTETRKIGYMKYERLLSEKKFGPLNLPFYLYQKLEAP